jgi:hypothetical protein
MFAYGQTSMGNDNDGLLKALSPDYAVKMSIPSETFFEFTHVLVSITRPAG